MAFANMTGMTVGQDLQLVMFTPVALNGSVAVGSFTSDSIGRLVGMNAVPRIHEVEGTPLDLGGIALDRNIYRGWEGDIDFIRYNGNLSLLMQSIMSNFNVFGNESYFNIEAVVYNVIQQTQDTYTFLNCVLSQGNLGNFAELSRVDQRLHFRGQNMLVNGQVPSALPNLANLPGSSTNTSV
jgi:hypothetical protein